MSSFTKIPLADLAAVRLAIHKHKPPGIRIRTFYLGPRGKSQGQQARQTTRERAVAAKIGVYSGGRLLHYI